MNEPAVGEIALAKMSPFVWANSGDHIDSGMVGSPATIRQRLKAYEDAQVQELII